MWGISIWFSMVPSTCLITKHCTRKKNEEAYEPPASWVHWPFSFFFLISFSPLILFIFLCHQLCYLPRLWPYQLKNDKYPFTNFFLFPTPQFPPPTTFVQLLFLGVNPSPFILQSEFQLLGQRQVVWIGNIIIVT